MYSIVLLKCYFGNMNSADLFVNLYLLEMLDLYKMVGPKVATKSSSAC